MAKTNLQEKNIQELREMATKAELEGRAGMSKDELVAALSADNGPTKAEKESKAQRSDATPDRPPGFPVAGMTIKGQNKGNTVGLFQTAPDVKEYMTAEEARSKGFYVAKTPEEAERNVKQ